MSNPYKAVFRPIQGYYPTAPVTGEQADYIYQGLNVILKGGSEFKYLEQYTGYGLFAASGSNTLATGTAAITTGSNTVTGTSTKFLSEFVPGQEIAISSRVYTVFRIDSDTSMQVSPAAASTGSGIQIAILQQIQALDTVILTLIRGSVVRLPEGHLLGAGRGAVRINGSVLAGGGWTLTDQPQLAIYNPGNGNYTPYRLGMTTPVAPTLANVAGGTKMAATTYSVRIVSAKSATKGWNQASPSASVTLMANQRVQITFPAMDTGAGQDVWKVYVTLSTNTTPTQGPWYDFGRFITTAEVSSGGGNVTIEWADAEVSQNDLLEFDNDPATSAGFVASLGGLPVLISCNGAGRVLSGTAATTAASATITGTSTQFTSELAVGRFVWINDLLYRVTVISSNTSMTVATNALATASGLTIRSADETPGPVIRPAKSTVGGYNFEAYPARSAVAIDPPDPIIGYYQAQERIYLLTANSLNFAEASGDPDVPLVTKPFWTVGFRNPRAIAFANGYLYAFTTNGATRSAAFGDKVETEHAFAAPVDSIMSTWDAGKVTVAYNQQIEAICYMHADDGTRSGGTARYGTLLPFMLRMGVWGPPLRMEDLSDVDPTYATSTATVQGVMYFASPTNAGATNIYTVSVANGEVGEVFAASPFMDMGAEGFDKTVEGLILTAGRSTAANIVCEIYGSVADGAVPISDLQAGGNSQSGQLTFGVNTPVVTTARKKMNVRKLRTVAVRVRMATQDSVSARLDELKIDGEIDTVSY